MYNILGRNITIITPEKIIHVFCPVLIFRFRFNVNGEKFTEIFHRKSISFLRSKLEGTNRGGLCSIFSLSNGFGNRNMSTLSNVINLI